MDPERSRKAPNPAAFRKQLESKSLAELFEDLWKGVCRAADNSEVELVDVLLAEAGVDVRALREKALAQMKVPKELQELREKVAGGKSKKGAKAAEGACGPAGTSQGGAEEPTLPYDEEE